MSSCETGAAGTRKTHPNMPEILEHKLKFTPDLRCEKQTDLVPVCYSCKSCIVSWKIFSTREWFMRASHTTQRQFLVGIIKRLKKRDLLKYVWNILQSVNGKDFTYTRSCVSSNLTASSTLDRALDPRRLEQAMTDLWRWFLSASFWTKANYMLLLLRMCDSRLLLMAANLIHILLAQDERKTSKKVVIGNAVQFNRALLILALTLKPGIKIINEGQSERPLGKHVQ